MDEEEIYKLLHDLRLLKQTGELDSNENLARQTLKWRNTLEYSVLEACVKHHSEKCRLEVLALLVESKKSTLRFTNMELDMILSFLKYNLCERMEYMRFIKKALKRLKDSLTVMQRELAQEIKIRDRHKEDDITSETYKSALALSYKMSEQTECDVKDYATFFISLREICVSSLYPDATYHRRRSCLRILLLAQDLLSGEFRDVEWRKEQAETIFQCLLLDTYEPNKEMAYQILKSMNPALLHLDSESQVQLLIEVALELGNGIRPIDSVTAAYMLKISKLSPVIKNVLYNYCDTEDYVTDAVTLRLVLLLYKRLQNALASARGNVAMAIVKCSLYGHLFCMRSLLHDCDLRDAGINKSWQDAVANIILLCFELSRTVSTMVNNSSPEGHLPMDSRILSFDDDDDDDNALFAKREIVTPQMVLLCSWRTVKEISQLFGLFATSASIRTSESTRGLLTETQIEHIMKHLVLLLCETKHRGAFEQVYVGFHQLCTRLWQLTDTILHALPMHCLHDTLIGITGLMPGYSKLCATRRSAGVPFMIQAVLSSEPRTRANTRTSAFRSVMKILLQFTELESVVNLWQKVKCIMYEDTIFSKYERLTELTIQNRNMNHCGEIKLTEVKTHSMNILRALFRHSQFGDAVKDYVADGLIAAFTNYDSSTWAERNAATLLFSALIVRIFGVQRTKDHVNLTTDNKMTGRIFFERYPSLLPFILNELRTFTSIDDTIIKSNVQAILLLLSRLYVNYHFDGTVITSKVDEFVSLISQCAKSPVHKTRELAARALVPFLTKSTAYGIVKKLFHKQLILYTTGITRTSANLMHGYLLQVLEILTRLPSVNVQLLKSDDFVNFLSAMNWILKDLEKGTNGYSCFPIAITYIDILHELCKADENITKKGEMCNMKDTLCMLQQHLIEENLLKQGPGEQIYKVSVLKFMLRTEKCSNFLRSVCNGQTRAFEVYSRLLIKPEAEVQSIAWNTVFEVLKREKESRQRKLLSAYAIRTAADFAEDLHTYNPKLQDAIFDFLYNSLIDTDERCNTDISRDKREICSLVLKKLHLHNASDTYCQRINYLRLLGKCVALSHELKDEEFRREYKEDIYRKVCDSSWIGSLDKDFRSSIFNILYDLLDKDIDAEHCHPVLDWWTTLLQLLVDDNADVRCEASKLICRIEPCNKLECIERTLPVFFQKFNKMVADKYPGIAISALFCWSVSLENIDYEMNETDVFNKCRNYDVFEPVRISQLCFDLINSITQRYTSTLPPDAVKWINYRLDTDFITELSYFKDIVHNYMCNIPILEKALVEILDPTYKDKLLHILACEKYASLIARK